jgi:hypothetical protein
LRTVSPSHTSQRVKVGVIGLVAVVLLIALASAILGAVTRERPVIAPGGAKPEIVANMAGGNLAAPSAALSDMGVSPGVGNGAASAR